MTTRPKKVSNTVLIRGLTREARHWGGFADVLALATGAPAVATPDLPGSGVLHRETSPASVTGMVAALRSQLQAQQLAPPYSLVALSLGGMVAVEWARQFPHEVGSLVLINTSLRPFSRVTQRLRPQNWPQLALLAARWGDAVHAENGIHRLTCRQSAHRAGDIAQWLAIRRSAPVSAPTAARQLWAAARFHAADAPTCPVLVLSSAGDALVDPGCSARLAGAWQAAHAAHPWAGHDLPHDDPGWVAGRIALWQAR